MYIYICLFILVYTCIYIYTYTHMYIYYRSVCMSYSASWDPRMLCSQDLTVLILVQVRRVARGSATSSTPGCPPYGGFLSHGGTVGVPRHPDSWMVY